VGLSVAVGVLLKFKHCDVVALKTQPLSIAVAPPAAVMMAGTVPRSAALKLVYPGAPVEPEMIHPAGGAPVKKGLTTKLLCACARLAQKKHRHANMPLTIV
jgi:hypothetical protein